MTQSLVNRFGRSSQKAALALTATSLLLPMLVASQAVAGGNPDKKLPPQPSPRTLRPTPNGATTVKATRTEGVEVKPLRKKTTKAVVKTAKPKPVVAKTTKKAKPTVAKTTTAKRIKTSATPTEARVSRKSSRTSRSAQTVRSTRRTRRTATTPVERRSTQTLVKLAKPPVAPLVQVYPPYRKTVPPGSYVKKPVRTDKAPYDQAITRPEILQRYQYVWKTSPAETLQRLNGLKLTQLPQGGIYRVYYTRANGGWGYKVRTVPAGTWVYSLPENARPMMLQVCGNPVEAIPPALADNNKPPKFSPLEPNSDLILEEPATELASMVSATPALPSLLGELSTPSIYSGLVGGVGPGLLAAAAGFGIALPFGSSGGNTPPPPPRPRINGTVFNGLVTTNAPPPPPPVPEPSGFVFAGTLLGTMGAALGRPLLAKRKRRRQDA